MATLVQTPDALSLSYNLKEVIISTSVEVRFRLKKGSAVLLDENYLPDSSGLVTIDIREVVSSSLSLSIPTTDTYEQTEAAASFSIFLDSAVSAAATFTAVLGGVRGGASASTFLPANFLTWQSQEKNVTPDQPEWLTYYHVGAYVMKAKFYNKDGTDKTVTLMTGTAGKVYSVNCQFAHLWPLGATTVGGVEKPRYGFIDVWVENSGTRLTYVQRYCYRRPESLDEVYVCFNSIGGIDTFLFEGIKKFVAEMEHSVGLFDRKLKASLTETKRKYGQNTGILTFTNSGNLIDFFSSIQAFYLDNGTIVPIVLDTSTIECSNIDTDNNWYFEYRISDDDGLLNVSRTRSIPSIIEIPGPEGGTFYLAPRVIDYPAAIINSNLLILLQSPYSQTWMRASLGDLSKFFLNNKQDTLIPGANITIGADGKTISATGILSPEGAVMFNAPQSITSAQKKIAQNNIGAAAAAMVTELGGVLNDKVLSTSANLFNIKAIENGYQLTASGSKTYNANWVDVRGLIKIYWGDHTNIATNCHMGYGQTYSWQFDSSGTKITGTNEEGVGNKVITRAEGAEYLYLSVDLSVSRPQINYGATLLTYSDPNPILGYLGDYERKADLPADLMMEKTPVHLYASSSSGTQDATHFYGYNAIRAAIAAIPANNTRPYFIHAKGCFNLSQDSQYASPSEYPEYHYAFYVPTTKRDISIIGEGMDRTFVTCYLPDNLGGSFEYDKYIGCEILGDNCKLSGMTIAVRNMRYAIHLDRSAYTYCNGYHISFEGVRMVHYGNTGDAATAWSATPAPFGVGISDGMTITVKGCVIERTDNTPIYFHDNANFANPYLFEIIDTEICTKGGYLMTIQNLGSGVQGCISLTGIRNANGGIISAQLSNDGLDDIDLFTIPMVRVITDLAIPLHYQPSGGGKVLRIEADANNHSVRFDENSDGYARLCKGRNTNNRLRTDGVFEFNGCRYKSPTAHAKGWAMGLRPVDTGTDASIQKRLGDCTSSNVVLGLKLDGVTQNVTFDKNYTNYTNAQMLEEINSQLIGMTASIYHLAREYYPETPNLHRHYSDDTEPIFKGMGVQVDGGYIKRAVSTANLYAVALDDINPGECGRVLTKGILNTSYYSFNTVLIDNDAKNYNNSARFAISGSAPGHFVRDDQNGVLKARNYSNIVVDL